MSLALTHARFRILETVRIPVAVVGGELDGLLVPVGAVDR